MMTAPDDKTIERLYRVTGTDRLVLSQAAEIVAALDKPLGHLHGLTKTMRPLMQRAAAVMAAFDDADREAVRHGALPRRIRQAATRDLTAPHCRMVVDAVERALHGNPHPEPDSIEGIMALRLAALMELVDIILKQGGNTACVAGVEDDGDAVTITVVPADEALDRTREARLWNAVMMRPVRAIKPWTPDYRTPVLLTPATRMADAAGMIIRRQMEQFMTREYGYAYLRDDEFVHETRVATRRMRASLRVFKKVLGDEGVALKNALSDVASLLGDARDADVFLRHLCDYAETAPARHQPFLQRLIHAERACRYRYYRAVCRAVATDAHARFKQRYYAKACAPPGSPEGFVIASETDNLPIAEAAPGALTKAMKKLKRYPPPLSDYTPKVLHKLRIACKRVRYAAEFLGDAYPDKLTRLIGSMKTMQGLLGDVHDADVFRERLDAYCHHRHRSAGTQDHAAIAAFAAHLNAWQRAQRSAAVVEWGALVRPVNWKRLEKYIAAPCTVGAASA